MEKDIPCKWKSKESWSSDTQIKWTLILKIILFIYFVLGYAESSLLGGLLSSFSEWAYSLDAVWGLCIVVASLVTEHRLWVLGLQWLLHMGSTVVALRLSCSLACGIFLFQGSNPCLFHWQADSLPLSHQGNPHTLILIHPLCLKRDLKNHIFVMKAESVKF